MQLFDILHRTQTIYFAPFRNDIRSTQCLFAKVTCNNLYVKIQQLKHSYITSLGSAVNVRFPRRYFQTFTADGYFEGVRRPLYQARGDYPDNICELQKLVRWIC